MFAGSATEADVARLLDIELAKGWGERRSPELARLFDAKQGPTQRYEARIAVWWVAGLYILFAATDAVLIADVFVYALTARIVIGLAYASAITFQINHGVKWAIVELQCAVGVILGFAIWMGLVVASRNTDNVLYYAAYGTVFMLVANLFFNLRFRTALITSGSIAGLYLLTSLTLFPPSLPFNVAIGSLYVLSFVLTLFINWKMNIERYRVFLNSLSAEIRQVQARARGEELLKLSTTDALTELANRRATDDHLQEVWREWKAGGKPFAVLLIDVDFFKLFNDMYGHQQGDLCLVTLSRAMETVACSHGGRLGRFGGEEFILLLRAETADQAMTVAEEIRGTIAGLAIPHEARSDPFTTVTVSIGVAFSKDVDATKPERIVTEADRALYWAKDSKRNCVRLFDQTFLDREEASDSVVEHLRTAIAENRVSLVYQPIWNVRTNRIHAVEALMRLSSPNGVPISPANFIPVAERTGAIIALGEWALREACRQLRECPGLPVISVNVSSVQMARPEFARTVAAILDEAGVAPSRLALEITEGSDIDGSLDVLRTISELKKIGIRLWLDDFGTGFAGLSCLSKIDFETVKIDRLFVQASDTARGLKLLKDMVRLVSNSGHQIVLEGVETEKQCELLKKLGLTILQGYFFNRPVAMDDLKRLLGDDINVEASCLAA